jgi:hypothetical protein
VLHRVGYFESRLGTCGIGGRAFLGLKMRGWCLKMRGWFMTRIGHELF